MPVNPLLKYMFNVFKIVVKNSNAISKLVIPLIDKAINDFSDFLIKQGLDQIPGIKENLVGLKQSIITLTPPTLIIPSVTDPKVLAYIKKMSKDARQQKYNEISSLEDSIKNIIISKNKLVTEINNIQQQMLKVLGYVDQPIEGLGISLPTLIETVQLIVDLLGQLPLVQVTAVGPVAPPVTLSKFSPLEVPFKIAEKSLDTLSGIVEFIRSIGGTILKYVNVAKGYLNLLDGILTPILDILSFIKTLLQLDIVDDPNFNPESLTQSQIETINNQFYETKSEVISSVGFAASELTDISNNPQVNQALDAALLAQLQPDSLDPYIYKDFILTIEDDPNNKFSFASRRVKAKGIGGKGSFGKNLEQVILYNSYASSSIDPQTGRTIIPFELTGSYSYSATTQVLVNEAQLIIDQFLNPPPLPKDTQSISNPTSNPQNTELF